MNIAAVEIQSPEGQRPRRLARILMKTPGLESPGFRLAGRPDKLLAWWSPFNCVAHQLQVLPVVGCRLKGSWGRLGAPPGPYREVPHLRQNARHLHAIQLRDKGQQGCDKLIFDQFADFLPAIAFSTA